MLTCTWQAIPRLAYTYIYVSHTYIYVYLAAYDVSHTRLIGRMQGPAREVGVAYVSIRQHTSAYVSIRQHTSGPAREVGVACECAEVTREMPAFVDFTANPTYMRQHTSAYVSIRQHTSAYVSNAANAAFVDFAANLACAFDTLY